VTLVHASRGKITRAEPIAALSEQKRLHMVGTFAALEDELCSYDGTGNSPNRLDALVWACTELGLHITPSAGIW
jgi:phage terminase large subunit-like protein